MTTKSHLLARLAERNRRQSRIASRVRLGAFVCAALASIASASSVARADDGAPTVGDASPYGARSKKVAPAKAPPPAPQEAAEAPKGPFDGSALGAIDPVTVKAIAALDEACVSSPMSREGMTREEEARCNLAMARITARGKAGASAILASLDDSGGNHPYYARSQLYAALGKLDDEKVREAVVAGYEKIAKEKLEDFESDSYELDETLKTMFATGPEADIPWETTPVADNWATLAATTAAWRKVATDNAGKKRNEILIGRLTAAKKDKKSDDPKVAYRAIAYLLRPAPREAKTSAHLYAARKDLPEDVASAFGDLESEAEFRLTVPNANMRM
ncbi:MAG TPA: hypothetical protein VL400_00405 [Polyangiaceae bacterium]|nr:hypothetical protein [Polyangiaceae bacterium]